MLEGPAIVGHEEGKEQGDAAGLALVAMDQDPALMAAGGGRGRGWGFRVRWPRQPKQPVFRHRLAAHTHTD